MSGTRKRTGGIVWRQVMEYLTEHQVQDNDMLNEALKLVLTEHREEAAEMLVALARNGQHRMRILALLSANGINDVEQIIWQIEPPKGKGKGD